MAGIRLFNPSTGRRETFSQRQVQEKTRKSAQWFRDTIKNEFGRKPTRAATNARETIDVPPRGGRRPTRAERAEGNARKADNFLNSNTTITSREFKQNTRIVKTIEPGRLYMYVYDPKLKKSLPYYDVFPMVFVTDIYTDGFLGLNIHYLPHILRARLMEELFIHTKDVTRKGKREKFLNISYEILKSASANKYFKPTIKRYLSAHIRSPFVEVLYPAYELAAFLPVEQFRKKTKMEVWAESRAEING